MALKRILSGMRPTGKLHLGNLHGALRNWIELQNSGIYDCFYFVADWHALIVGSDLPGTDVTGDEKKPATGTATASVVQGRDPQGVEKLPAGVRQAPLFDDLVVTRNEMDFFTHFPVRIIRHGLCLP